MMSKIIGAVEIGTSHAKVLIGEVGENKKLSIVGMASRSNEGMRKGEIIDFRSVAAWFILRLKKLKKCPAPRLIPFIWLRLGLT